MRARLQFSIATAVAPEILLIDEALTVGDRQFRRRSAKRIDEIREHAGTIFFVSHNLNEVRRSCTRGIWMGTSARASARSSSAGFISSV